MIRAETEQEYRDMMAFFMPRVTVTRDMINTFLKDLENVKGRTEGKIYKISPKDKIPNSFELINESLNQ